MGTDVTAERDQSARRLSGGSLRIMASQARSDTDRWLSFGPGTAIFLLAFALRVGAVLFVPEPELSPNAVGAFIGGAERLLDGRGFSDPGYPMFSPPLYAVGIAASFVVLGRSTLPIRLGQAALDASTVFLVFAITRRIFGNRAAIAAGGLAAIYPFAIYAATYIGTETPFSFALALFVWLSVCAVASSSWRMHASTGTVLGLASLVRGSTQFYPIAWAATLWLTGRRDAGSWARWTAASACFVAIISPWALRNYLVLGSFIPLATSANPFLCGSSEEFFTIEGREERMRKYFALLEHRGWKKPDQHDIVQMEAFQFRAGLEKYRERFERGGVLGMGAFFAKKFLRLWYATESGNNHGLILVTNLPIYVLGIAGILLARQRKLRLAWLPAMPVIYLAALHTAVYGYFRYILPAMPLLLCFAGYALAALLERVGLVSEIASRPAVRAEG